MNPEEFSHIIDDEPLIKLQSNTITTALGNAKHTKKIQSAFQQFCENVEKGTLGFARLPFEAPTLSPMTTLAIECRDRFKTLVVLGIGGSSLGGQAALEGFQNGGFQKGVKHPKQVLFWDFIDPESLIPALEKLELKHTCFFIVSKSGSTLETWAQWAFIQPILEKSFGKKWIEHAVVCTDPKSSDLLQYAKKCGLRTLGIPSNVGGRFSVLTPVGLFPAAFLGLDPAQFLHGATHLGLPTTWNAKSVVLQLSEILLQTLEKKFSTHVLMSYSHPISRMTDWFVQLWAESLGKTVDGTPMGTTPLRAVGPADQHAQMQLFMEGPNDKLIGFLWNRKNPVLAPLQLDPRHPWPESAQLLNNQSLRHLLFHEFEATRMALEEARRPTYTVTFNGFTPESMGALFFLFECVTVLMGYALGINPLDQPGVERAKIITKERLKKAQL